MPGLSWAPGWRRVSQGEVKAGSRNWEPWQRVRHSGREWWNNPDKAQWQPKPGRWERPDRMGSDVHIQGAGEHMPRATESYLNRRLIGSGVCFQIFGTLLFSWNSNQGSRVVDPGGGSEGSGGQEVDSTELMGCLDAGWMQGLSQRLPLALGRKKMSFFFKKERGISLVVQWLKLHTANAGSNPWSGNYMPCKAAKRLKNIFKKLFLKERKLNWGILWKKKTARILTPMSS